MRLWVMLGRGFAVAALVWLAIPGPSAFAQGSGRPPTPEEERFNEARDRADMEIAALKAKTASAEADLGRLVADRTLEQIREQAYARGFSELARSLEPEAEEPLDPVTSAILDALDTPASMPFPAPTPLEDIIKYVKSVTQSPALPQGIPIFVDPVGLQEAEQSESSPVTINLEGVPLKRAMKLLLKQLGLSYSVEGGVMTIGTAGCFEGRDEIQAIRRRLALKLDLTAAALGRVVPFNFADGTSLVDALEAVRKATEGAQLPKGLMIVVDSKVAAKVAGATVGFRADDQPVKSILARLLGSQDLAYSTRGGMIVVDEAGKPAPVPPNADAPNGGVRPEPAEPEAARPRP